MLLSISNGLVIAMGLGVVFFGLICIIFLIWLLGKIIGVLVKDKPGESITPPLPAAPAAPAARASSGEIPNRPEFVAAVSAAIAEELGTDINKIQIISIKKI
ncbi:MAG: OadG family protein [Firmicutes bacterium]|nr:OadG family protein [Bacillota bacterium]